MRRALNRAQAPSYVPLDLALGLQQVGLTKAVCLRCDQAPQGGTQLTRCPSCPERRSAGLVYCGPCLSKHLQSDCQTGATSVCVWSHKTKSPGPLPSRRPTPALQNPRLAQIWLWTFSLKAGDKVPVWACPLSDGTSYIASLHPRVFGPHTSRAALWLAKETFEDHVASKGAIFQLLDTYGWAGRLDTDATTAEKIAQVFLPEMQTALAFGFNSWKDVMDSREAATAEAERSKSDEPFALVAQHLARCKSYADTYHEWKKHLYSTCPFPAADISAADLEALAREYAKTICASDSSSKAGSKKRKKKKKKTGKAADGARGEDDEADAAEVTHESSTIPAVEQDPIASSADEVQASASSIPFSASPPETPSPADVPLPPSPAPSSPLRLEDAALPASPSLGSPLDLPALASLPPLPPSPPGSPTLEPTRPVELNEAVKQESKWKKRKAKKRQDREEEAARKEEEKRKEEADRAERNARKAQAKAERRRQRPPAPAPAKELAGTAAAPPDARFEAAKPAASLPSPPTSLAPSSTSASLPQPSLASPPTATIPPATPSLLTLTGAAPFPSLPLLPPGLPATYVLSNLASVTPRIHHRTASLSVVSATCPSPPLPLVDRPPRPASAPPDLPPREHRVSPPLLVQKAWAEEAEAMLAPPKELVEVAEEPVEWPFAIAPRGRSASSPPVPGALEQPSLFRRWKMGE
ncbi:hypothetical protein JCM10213_007353 [Rhodosporidiobolus nylandii]